MAWRSFLILWFGLLWTFSCKQITMRDAPLSEAYGVPSSVIKRPPLRSRREIAIFKTTLVKCHEVRPGMTKLLEPKVHLQSVLVDEIVRLKGIPRVQMESLLDDLVTSSVPLCGGAGCGPIFGLTSAGIKGFFDDLEKSVLQDPRFLKPENHGTREILLGSLTKQTWAENLALGEPRIWTEFIKKVGAQGAENDDLRTVLVPTMRSFDDESRTELLQEISSRYKAAYKVKLKVTGGLAPKRAYDVMLRYMAGPERFFNHVRGKDQTMEAWRLFFDSQKRTVFKDTDFGSYTPEDVVAVARRMQSFLVAKGPAAQDVQILLKGSFPSGKANLRRKNPFDNWIDSIMTGFESSYSDIDFLINGDWEKTIKAIEPEIYQSLVSNEARDLVFGSKAKAFFQTHPDPFDLFAELDGSIMSPVGLRIDQRSLTLVIYKPNAFTELPSRDAISRMSEVEKKALYERWASFYPL